MDFKEYQSWLKPLLKPGKAISPDVTQYTPEIVKENGQILIRIIQQHISNKEYSHLAALAEYLRGKGFFYFDYVDEMGTMLELMLSQAITIFDNEEVLRDHHLIWLPHGLYDLIFHQIRFEEYPPVCFELYFEMSKRVLDPHFMPLYEVDQDWSYSMCLSFIDKADYEFAKEPAYFFQLWKLIQKGNVFQWNENNWPDTYKELMGE